MERVDHLKWHEEQCVILDEVPSQLFPMAFVLAKLTNRIIRGVVMRK